MLQPETLSGEFAYIAWVRQLLHSDPRVPVGVGDDAAVVKLTPGRELLVTTDMILEGVHFDLKLASFEQVGRKALAVNLSDIAAMAGNPIAAVVAVGLPADIQQNQAERLFQGIHQLAQAFGVAIIGGDTNRSQHGLVISITLFGETTQHGPVRRSGAEPGDWIFVTDSLGGSLAGKHLDFMPRVQESLLLHSLYRLSAMIDISDGLAADLGHILEESQCGAVVRERSIPISDAARQLSGDLPALQRALYDGEDFELLFTVPSADARRLVCDRSLKVAITHIGEIKAGSDLLLENESGEFQRIEPRGYDHFRH